MNISPIDAVAALARVSPLESAQPLHGSLPQHQDLFEQLMMQNGFAMLDMARGGDANQEDDEA